MVVFTNKVCAETSLQGQLHSPFLDRLFAVGMFVLVWKNSIVIAMNSC
jgi:hypothetical protein